jgi:hypothetical protein
VANDDDLGSLTVLAQLLRGEKERAMLGDQVVDYVAMIDDSRTRIAGSYLSQSPYDYGFSWIRYY